MSAGTFTILSRITVTAPNTNVIKLRGQVYEITWTDNLGSIERVNIELTRNDGATWEVIASSAPNTRTFDWLVKGPVTSLARIRINWALDSTVHDTSDTTFRIQ
jgi:hypothetical protein